MLLALNEHEKLFLDAAVKRYLNFINTSYAFYMLLLHECVELHEAIISRHKIGMYVLLSFVGL